MKNFGLRPKDGYQKFGPSLGSEIRPFNPKITKTPQRFNFDALRSNSFSMFSQSKFGVEGYWGKIWSTIYIFIRQTDRSSQILSVISKL